MSASLIVGAILVLLAIVIIARTVNIIQQGYVGIVKRLGEFHSIRQPGVTFLVPLFDSMVTVDIRETPRTGDKQDVITRDNVTVSVNATIFSQVVDPKLALFSVSNYFVAIDQLSRTTLRAIFGGMTLDDALSQRERINAQLQAQMESVTDKWGIRINRIEIVDITPPQAILNAMALHKRLCTSRQWLEALTAHLLAGIKPHLRQNEDCWAWAAGCAFWMPPTSRNRAARAVPGEFITAYGYRKCAAISLN